MDRSVSSGSLVLVAFLILLAPALLAVAPTRAQTFTTPCDDVVDTPLPDSSEPPNVVEQPIDEALSRLDEWNRSNWKGRAPIDQIPESLPVDRSLGIVIDQAVDHDAPPTVSVCVGTRVPDLTGHTLSEASTVLDKSALVAGVMQPDADDDWTVGEQSLPSGLLVPFGTEVGFTLLPPEIPSTIVTVPDIVGLSPQEAARVVDATGLVLEVQTLGEGGEGIVIEQDPPPGTQVDPNTSVLATVELQAGGEISQTGDETTPASALAPRVTLLALLALVVLAIVTALALRNRLQRKWVLTHVTAKEGTAGALEISTDGTNDRPARVAQLEPYADPGSQTLEEIP